MADEDTLTEEEAAEVFAESLQDSGFRENDDQYVGTAPDYQHAAYETDAPAAEQDPDSPEAEMRARVQEHEAKMAQPANEPQAFSDWVGERQLGVGGPGSSRVSKSGPVTKAEDADDSETATDDDPRSTSELHRLATEYEIPGRSSMGRPELLAALAEYED